jgi:hypothetical protein
MSSDKEVDECGTGARWPAKCGITEEELFIARFLVNREPFQDRERFGRLAPNHGGGC